MRWLLLICCLSITAGVASGQTATPTELGEIAEIATPASEAGPDVSSPAGPAPSGIDTTRSDLASDLAQVLNKLGPTFQHTSYLGWGLLLVCIFVGVVLGKIASMLLTGAGHRLEKKGRPIRGMALLDLAAPMNLTFITTGLLLGLRFIVLEDTAVEMFAGRVLMLMYLVAVGWLAYNLVDVLDVALTAVTSKTASKIDDQIVPLIRKTLRIFLVVLFTLVIADNVFEVDITAWLAGLGIAGLGVSLAAQDSIRNLFGSITVLFDKPFVIGDWVVVDDIEGIVEEVGFRSTRIRTFYNSQVTLPNANLINASVDNYGRRQFRRWKTNLCVQYDTSPDKLVAFTEGVRELIRTHPYTRKDYYQVYCNEFGDSSLNILLYMFFDVPDWNTELRERDRLFVDIVRLADRLGVQFAFPTRTVHLFKEEHGEPQSEYQPPESMTDRRATIDGIRAAHVLTEKQPWIKEKPAPVEIRGSRTDIAYDDAGNPITPEEAAEREGAKETEGERRD